MARLDRGEGSMGRAVEVPDEVRIVVPRGGRVVVMSDLHLVSRATSSSTRATDALAEALERWDGPGVVVLAGDCFELLGEPHLDPGLALDAHPRFTAAVAAFAGRRGAHVVVLPGNHDGQLAWHRRAGATVRERLGATLALAAELELDCGAGPRRVRVEHGHQLDPANAFVDPRDPAETPFGHHVVRDMLPQLDGLTSRSWGQGLGLVADPLDLSSIVSTRLLYRQVLPVLGLGAIPALLAALLGIARALGAPPVTGTLALAAALIAAVLTVAVVGGAAFWGGVGWRAFGGWSPDTSGGADPGNEAARRRAVALGADGVAVYVTGHTHIPELGTLGDVVYANPGCGGGLLHRRPGRGPLPPTFAVARHVSWIELEAGQDLAARLIAGHEEVGGLSRLERWATRPAPPAPATPAVVTALGAPAAVAASTTGSTW